jgi:hypothetical protein
VNVRAERRLWEKLPEDRWLTQDELREIVTDNKPHPMAVALADAAISWLVEGKYVRWRAVPSTRRHPNVPPPFEYARNALSQIPFEAMVQMEAEELQRQRGQVKSQADLAIDQRVEQRLRELGLVNDTVHQEA